MRTGTGGPAPTKITLTYEEDAWLATDETTGVTAQAATREAALAALDEAVATHTDQEASEVDLAPDDSFFVAATFSSGTSDISENVDTYLVSGSDRDMSAADDDT